MPREELSQLSLTGEENKDELIKNFRSKVPLITKDKLTYFEATRLGPMNAITENAISGFVTQFAKSADIPDFFQVNRIASKQILSKYLHVPLESLLFTRDSTDGSVLFSLAMKFNKGDNILVMSNEFPNLFGYWENFCKSHGLELRVIEPEDPFHVATVEDFESMTDLKTKLIVMSSVRYDTGIKNDTANVIKVFRAKGAEVLVDICQDVGFNKVDLKQMNPSAAVFSCYKGFYVPIGLGVLYVDPELIPKLNPVFSNPTNLDPFNPFEHGQSPHILVALLKDMLIYLEKVGFDEIDTYLKSLGQLMISELSKIGIDIPETKGERSSHSYVYKITNPAWGKFLRDSKVYVSQYHNMRISIGLHTNESDIHNLVLLFKRGQDLGIAYNL